MRIEGHDLIVYRATPELIEKIRGFLGAADDAAKGVANAAAQAELNKITKAENPHVAVGKIWRGKVAWGGKNLSSEKHLLSASPIDLVFPANLKDARALERFADDNVNPATIKSLLTLQLFKESGKTIVKMDYEAGTSLVVFFGDAFYLIDKGEFLKLNTGKPPMRIVGPEKPLPAGYNKHSLLHAFAAPDHGCH
ncbi:MAG: hypothetical protein GC131_03740 [Alphaproteobacteria bacterium]|nr:hypothetical protein [Alphaproteobacteria bacterium]